MEQINLNIIIPDGVLPVCHASQFDKNRTIRFNLKDNGSIYTLAGTETITCKVRKPDDTENTINVANTSLSYVDVTFGLGDTDLSGYAMCELKIVKGTQTIGSRNFLLNIEADAFDGSKLEERSASGAIASFETNYIDNLNELIVNITATQAGSGTPSPDNVREILGFDNEIIKRCGVNLWDEEWQNGYYSPTNGKYVSDAHYICSKNLIKVLPSTQYYIHSDNNILIEVLEYRIDGTYIRRLSSGIANETITTDNDGAYIHIGTHNSDSITTYTSGVSINYPSSETDYHAYNGNTHPFEFGQTVYGGHLNVTKGELIVTHSIVDLGNLTWDYIPNYQLFSSVVIGKKPSMVDGMVSQYVNGGWWTGWTDKDYVWCGNANNSVIVVKDTRFTDAISFKNGVSGVMLVYPLSAPTTVQLTPTEVRTLLADNNIFADTGDVVSCKYLVEVT